MRDSICSAATMLRPLVLLGLVACGSRPEPRSGPAPSGVATDDPPTLTPLRRACEPGPERLTVTTPPEAASQRGEVLRLHPSGLLEIALVSAKDDGSLCPVAVPGTDDEVCVAPAVARDLFAARGPGEPSPALAARVRRAEDEALRLRQESACAAGTPCGIALERVELEHPHHPTSFRFRAEIWSDGRWRCERPETGTGLHEGGCAYLGASMGQVAPAAAARAMRWLLDARSVQALQADSDEVVLHRQRDFDRLVLYQPAPALVGGRPTAQAFARWARIASDLDPRCVPPAATGRPPRSSR